MSGEMIDHLEWGVATNDVDKNVFTGFHSYADAVEFVARFPLGRLPGTGLFESRWVVSREVSKGPWGVVK